MKLFKNRKAISPVLATVILIAITLIAAVAIAGFVFGLFGTLSSGANVKVITTTCSIAGGSFGGETVPAKTCALTLTNTGNVPATVTSCALYGAGLVPKAGTAAGDNLAVAAGQSGDGVFCGPGAGTYTTGEAVSGSVTMSNGVTIPFAGTWVA